jgi:hypothetical protein
MLTALEPSILRPALVLGMLSAPMPSQLLRVVVVLVLRERTGDVGV